MLSNPPIREEQVLEEDERRRLRAALSAMDLTQKAFADKYDCSASQTNRMLQGRHVVDADYAEHFNDLLGKADNWFAKLEREHAAAA